MKGMRLSDYQALRFEEPIPKMDVVFDTVGGETLQRSWGVLKPGGRMITIAAESETTTDTRVKQAYFIVEPHHEQLIRIGNLLESGALHPVVDAVLPLTQASAAYTGAVRERRGRGKLVVTVGDDRTARLWEAGTGAQLAVLRGHWGGVNDAAFSPDGKLVVTASSDETARLWDAVTR